MLAWQVRVRRGAGIGAWLSAAAVAGTLGLTTVAAEAQSAAPIHGGIAARSADETAPTFAYDEGHVEPNYLRAFLEFQAVFMSGFLWYATTTNKNWQVDYSWPVFRKKLLGQAFALDTNHFGTNFIGHPLGGTGYYLAARGNRLSVLSSFAFAHAGSGLWELFGEVGEIMSANDTIVTPFAGLALGESFTQLGAFFDRSAPSTTNRVLGSVWGASKSLNDALDGLHPTRAGAYDELGFPVNEWHRFDLALLALLSVEQGREGQPARSFGEGRIELSSELARLTGYASAAARNQWFTDANLSSISLELSASPNGVNDAWFTTRAVLFGHYYRDARSVRGELAGGGTVVGMASGFSYAVHDFERASPGPRDRIAGVRPVGLVFASRVTSGGLTLVADVDAGPDFAGVRPLALAGYLQQGKATALSPVLQLHGYYLAAGYHVTSSLGVRMGSIELKARLRSDGFVGVDPLGAAPRTDPDVIFRDFRSVEEARLGYHLSPHTQVTLEGVRRLRLGAAGAARAEAKEWSLGAGFQAVL